MGLLEMGSVPPDSDCEEAWLRLQAIHPGHRRSVTDEDPDELRGCIDLGSSFNEVASADVAPARRLSETLPALDLYYAVLCGVADLRFHRGLRCLARIRQHRPCAFLLLLSSPEETAEVRTRSGGLKSSLGPCANAAELEPLQQSNSSKVTLFI